MSSSGHSYILNDSYLCAVVALFTKLLVWFYMDIFLCISYEVSLLICLKNGSALDALVFLQISQPPGLTQLLVASTMENSIMPWRPLCCQNHHIYQSSHSISIVFPVRLIIRTTQRNQDRRSRHKYEFLLRTRPLKT